MLQELTEDAVHEKAAAKTKLSDFGDKSYLEGLRLVLEGVKAKPNNKSLHDRVSAFIQNGLVGRLYSEKGWKENPNCLNTKITAPLIIAGMPRTGTSALHQLMAMDEQFQWFPHWVSQAPMPIPPRDQWESHPKYKEDIAALEAWHNAFPGVRAAHNYEPGLPEECILVMLQSFTTMQFVSTIPLPDYHKWFFAQSEVPSYERFANNLRLFGHGRPEKRWLLKNPSHSMGMESLLKVFPDAMVIMTHRDPVSSITSGASMISIVGAEMWEDPLKIGPHRMKTWSRAAKRMEAQRQKFPQQFFEVGYNDIIKRPLDVVRSIYAHYGLTLKSETEQAMQDWMANNPQGKHGKHDYKPEPLGITPQMIREEMADYVERYKYA